MPSPRSWTVRAVAAGALLALAACGGGDGGDDGADTAKEVCEQLEAVLDEIIAAGGSLTPEQGRRLLGDLRSAAADADDAADEDSAYFPIANGLDQIINGLETGNADQVLSNQRTVARTCLDLFPDLNPTTSAPATTESEG